ncbi:MAG: hypothetical protein HGA37_14395, partial [Lentimicrobium sp.]|nr:hypothetical protein [Lentimicrobium sp.]
MMSVTRPLYKVFALLTVLYSLLALKSGAQETIRWMEPYRQQMPDETIQSWLNCEQCYNDVATSLPVYTFSLPAEFNVKSVSLADARYQALSLQELQVLKGHGEVFLPGVPEVSFQVVYDRGKPLLSLSLIPLRRNPVDGAIEKLISFDVVLQPDGQRALLEDNQQVQEYAAESVLSKGEWFRVSVNKSGLQQLTYDELS